MDMAEEIIIEATHLKNSIDEALLEFENFIKENNLNDEDDLEEKDEYELKETNNHNEYIESNMVKNEDSISISASTINNNNNLKNKINIQKQKDAKEKEFNTYTELRARGIVNTPNIDINEEKNPTKEDIANYDRRALNKLLGRHGLSVKKSSRNSSVIKIENEKGETILTTHPRHKSSSRLTFEPQLVEILAKASNHTKNDKKKK